MKQYTVPSSIGFQIFRAIPFLFEIKTFFDWTSTETALDLFQWLKFEEIYAVLYIAKCSWDLRWKTKFLGDKIPKVKKLSLGCFGVIFLLMLIFGPMLLFSTLNPVAKANPVVGATITVGIKINSNYYSIFTNSHVELQNFNATLYPNLTSDSQLQSLDVSTLQVILF